MAGRPKKLTEDDKKKILRLATFGFTDDQISEVFGITKQTLNNYKKYDSQFFDSLKAHKAMADIEVIESLFHRAKGMRIKEERAVVVSDGKDLGSHIEKVETWRELPPDVGASKLWLTNRQPELFKEKVEYESEQEITVNVQSYSKDDNE